MFEVSISSFNTGMEKFMPLFNGVIDNALQYTNPHVIQTVLQIVQILDLYLVKSVLHWSRPCSRLN